MTQAYADLYRNGFVLRMLRHDRSLLSFMNAILRMYIISSRACQLTACLYNLQMTFRSAFQRSPFRKIYAVPSEHGSWIWWIGPLSLGTAASGHLTVDHFLLAITMLFAFLIRQPLSLFVKVKSGRRPVADYPAIIFWIIGYGLILLVASFSLVLRGHARLFVLLLPGIPVFAWHLWLVARRAERGQRGIEIVGSGVLALAAPAGYWVGKSSGTTLPWVLWLLVWLQSAASIVLIYLRLEQRHWSPTTDLGDRLQRGSRTLAYHGVNLVLAFLLCFAGQIPWLIVVAFGIMLLDCVEGVLKPAVNQRPTRIGLRQLTASTLFFFLSAAAYTL
jgi:hypothetical protein